jgi:hypothetical protein
MNDPVSPPSPHHFLEPLEPTGLKSRRDKLVCNALGNLRKLIPPGTSVSR